MARIDEGISALRSMTGIYYLDKMRPIKEKKAIVKWAKSVQWLKLEILESTESTVKFNAYFFENGAPDHIAENSKFVKENNHWYYLGFAK